MRFVLIGGIGFVGMNLAEELRDHGEVVVVGRPSSARKRPRITEALRRLGAEVRLLERMDSASLASIGGDVYYHVAGVLVGPPSAFWDAHVGLLKEVVSAATQTGSRVVYVSSTAAMGEAIGVPPGSTLTEEEPHLDPARFSQGTIYELTKAEGERLLVRSSDALGGRWSIVRPSLVFGPWGYEIQWPLTYHLARRGLAPYFGSRNFIYSRDLARILRDAGSGLYDGRWVIASWPQDVDIGDVAVEICRQLQVECRLKVNVGRLMRLLPAVESLGISMMVRMLRFNYKYVSRVVNINFSTLERAVEDFLSWASSGMSA